MPAGQSAPADLLAALADALYALRAPWYVFGAQAVHVWGRPRLTADVDVTVRLDLGLIRSTLRLLEEALSQNDLLPLFESEVTRAQGD